MLLLLLLLLELLLPYAFPIALKDRSRQAFKSILVPFLPPAYIYSIYTKITLLAQQQIKTYNLCSIGNYYLQRLNSVTRLMLIRKLQLRPNQLNQHIQPLIGALHQASLLGGLVAKYLLCPYSLKLGLALMCLFSNPIMPANQIFHIRSFVRLQFLGLDR